MCTTYYQTKPDILSTGFVWNYWEFSHCMHMLDMLNYNIWQFLLLKLLLICSLCLYICQFLWVMKSILFLIFLVIGYIYHVMYWKRSTGSAYISGQYTLVISAKCCPIIKFRCNDIILVWENFNYILLQFISGVPWILLICVIWMTIIF